MMTFKQKGDFNNLEAFLKTSSDSDYKKILKKFAEKGVDALSEATPKRTGKTAASWKYEIKEEKDSVSIIWNNTNIINNVNVAMILQYGHMTKNGYYVKGIDYINPALNSIFEEIADAAWKEVINNASGR